MSLFRSLTVNLEASPVVSWVERAYTAYGRSE